MLRKSLAILGAVSILGFSSAVAAPSVVRQYSDWVVFTEDVGGERLCYAATQATDKAPIGRAHV